MLEILGCGLSTSAAYTRVFTVFVVVHHSDLLCSNKSSFNKEMDELLSMMNDYK